MRVLDIIDGLGSDRSLMRVRDALAPYGIRCNYDPPGSPKSRVILYTHKHNTKHWEIARECNGLVIDYRTWRVLCHTPDLPLVTYDAKTVETGLQAGTYDAYLADEGTIVNLYYHQGAWCISTIRGFDMGSVVWCGIRYRDALSDAGLDEKLMSTLDTNTNYTFGFTHPRMHPLNVMPRLWYVSSFTGGRRYWDRPPADIPQQRQVRVPDMKTVSKMLQDPSVFGLILRSRNVHRTLDSSTVLLESNLMRDIRQLLYDRTMTADAVASDVDRIEYIVTLSALHPERAKKFARIFPVYQKKVKTAQTYIDRMLQAVLARAGTREARVWLAEYNKCVSGAPATVEKLAEIICRRQYAEMWCRQIVTASKAHSS